MTELSNEMLDKRLVKRHLAKGTLSREAFSAHLEGLTDQEAEAENIWPMIMEGTQSEASVKVSTEELKACPFPRQRRPSKTPKKAACPLQWISAAELRSPMTERT